jgi:hypothetical protein
LRSGLLFALGLLSDLLELDLLQDRQRLARRALLLIGEGAAVGLQAVLDRA